MKVKCNVNNLNGSITSFRIAEARNKMGLNQKDFGIRLAEYLQRKKPFSIAAVSAWETARKVPMLNVLLAISELSGFSIDYLTGAENSINATIASDDETIGNHTIYSKIKNSSIPFNTLSNYDGKPVFAVFQNKTYPDGWALLDVKAKKLIFRDKEIDYDDLSGLELYPLETYSYKAFMKRNERPIGAQEFQQMNGKFWVEMTSSDIAIQAYYNGWYIWNKSRNAIVNMSNGEVLPSRGFSIAYKVYNGSDQRA